MPSPAAPPVPRTLAGLLAEHSVVLRLADVARLRGDAEREARYTRGAAELQAQMEELQIQMEGSAPRAGAA